MNGHRYRDGVNLEVRAKYDEVPAAEIQRRYMAGELDGEETCRNGEEEAAGCKRGRGAAAAEEVDEPSASQTGKEKRRAARMQRLAKCKKR